MILSGGTSKLRNIEACSEAVFGAPTRKGDNSALATGELRDPQYSVVIGLLKYGLQYQATGDEMEGRRSGLFGKLKRAFSIG